VKALGRLLGAIRELDDTGLAGHQITDELAGSSLDPSIARQKEVFHCRPAFPDREFGCGVVMWVRSEVRQGQETFKHWE
jgi:hypothetical protein